MVNKAIIVGNLGRDPDMRFTPSGQAVCEVLGRDQRELERQERPAPRTHRVAPHRRLGQAGRDLLEVPLQGPPGLRRGPHPDRRLRRQGRQQALHHRDHRPATCSSSAVVAAVAAARGASPSPFGAPAARMPAHRAGRRHPVLSHRGRGGVAMIRRRALARVGLGAGPRQRAVGSTAADEEEPAPRTTAPLPSPGRLARMAASRRASAREDSRAASTAASAPSDDAESAAGAILGDPGQVVLDEPERVTPIGLGADARQRRHHLIRVVEEAIGFAVCPRMVLLRTEVEGAELAGNSLSSAVANWTAGRRPSCFLSAPPPPVASRGQPRRLDAIPRRPPHARRR